jgi:hypothetical protein
MSSLKERESMRGVAYREPVYERRNVEEKCRRGV